MPSDEIVGRTRLLENDIKVSVFNFIWCPPYLGFVKAFLQTILQLLNLCIVCVLFKEFFVLCR